MFKTYARADNTLVWLNLVYLMANVFVPVPRAVLGAWLGDPGNQVVAAVFGQRRRHARPSRRGPR